MCALTLYVCARIQIFKHTVLGNLHAPNVTRPFYVTPLCPYCDARVVRTYGRGKGGCRALVLGVGYNPKNTQGMVVIISYMKLVHVYRTF